jgi:branched-chain amino acid transport system permease protein
MNMTKYTFGTLVVAALGGSYAMLVASPYVQAVLASILVYTIAVSGLNLLGGYGGYPNLAQATFMGVGAYGAAWTTQELGWSFWVQLAVTPLLAALVALVVAMPLLRLRGQYFAIASLLLGVVFTTILTNADGVGGSVGIGGFSRPVDDPVQWLGLLVVLTAVVTLVVARLATWPLGRHLVALRRDESLSESIGIPVYRRKLQAFVIGGFIAGVAGVLLGYNSYYISPDLFGFYESFLLFVALIVGGSGTVSGPLIGSAFLLGLPEVFRFAAEGRYLTMGVVFVVVMAIAPDGLAGVAGRLARRARRALRRTPARPRPGGTTSPSPATGPAGPAAPDTQTEKEISHARG